MRSSLRQALAVFSVGAVGLIGYFVWAHTKQAAFTSSIDALPDGALLVATADVRTLRKSSMFAPILNETGEIPGLGNVKDVCGFDPLERVTEVAMGIPASGADGDFGLVASGQINADALLACASKVIEARGGRPVVNPIGSFRTVRDASARAGGAEIAVRDGGPVLLGAGTYLRAMIDAADARIPRVATDVLHERLSHETGPGAIRITVVLTPEQRRTLNEELARGGAEGSPAAAMIGLGLAMSIETRVGLSGVVLCDAAQPCAALGRTFDARRNSQSDDPLMRLIGAKPLLERMKILAEGTRIAVRVDMSSDEATNLTERLVLLRQALQHRELQDSLEDKRPVSPPPRETIDGVPDAGTPDASARDAGVDAGRNARDAGAKP